MLIQGFVSPGGVFPLKRLKSSPEATYKEDAPEDLSNRQRYCDPRILGFRSGNGDRLTAGVERGTKHEDRRNAAETVGECTWIVPVFETYTLNALDTARRIYDREQEKRDEADKFDERKPKLGFTEGLDTKELETKKGKL